MAWYGRSDCEHQWVERINGYVEYCIAVVCKECGAFGCFCNVVGQYCEANNVSAASIDAKELMEKLKENGLAGDANINGRWENPYVKKEPMLKTKEYKCSRCGLIWDENVGYCGACGCGEKVER